MFKNYFKVALRNLSKQKLLSFISVFGLAVGIGCFCLFMLYALNEFSFDSFNKNANNVYRVTIWSQGKEDDPSHGNSYQPMPLGPTMQKDLPDVEAYVRFKEDLGQSFVKAGNTVSRERVSFADPSFFSVVAFKLKSGNATTALQDLHSVVLTEAIAEKLFGTVNPVGKIIEIKTEDEFVPFTVTAIAENTPSNSSVQFTMLGNFNYLATTNRGIKRINNWHQYSYQTYVQLKSGSHLPSDESRLIAFRKNYYPDEEKESRENGWTGKGPRIYYHLQPLRAIHTDTTISGGPVTPVNAKNIWILLSIAAGVLLIACINFTTLAIGRSANRAKEIGVRKVIGGTKKNLITQFISES